MANGIYGFRKNGVDKVSRIHPGGTIDHLGKTVLQYCQRNFAMDLIFDRIKFTQHRKYDLFKIESTALTEGTAYMRNDGHFLAEGWFDYAYIINLDTGNLEFWIGYQNEPQQPENRYAGKGYPCPHFVTEFLIKDIVAGGPLGIAGFMETAEEQHKKKEAN